MKIFNIVIAIIILLGGGYYYITRPVAEPTPETSEKMENIEIKEGFTLFTLSDESEAEFAIDEILNGEDFTAVGITNNISGSVMVNLEDLSKTEVSEIKINARTLKTDNSNRDGAIARLILKSENDENEFITFKPTSISGLPEGPLPEAVDFSIVGDLNVSGVTKEVTFSGTLFDVTEESLLGEVSATVSRSDFNLTVPDLPFIASVSDEVVLTFNFTGVSAQ